MNVLEWFARRYRTKWVEDLPEKTEKKMIYIIGGRAHPFYAAVTCPQNKCVHPVQLAISPDSKKRWAITEHQNGALSLRPSIYVTGLPCRCHYWVKKGRVIWSAMPCPYAPGETRTDGRRLHNMR